MPVQSLRFLGANIDSREGYLTIPENRIEKTLNTLADIKRDVESRGKGFCKKNCQFCGPDHIYGYSHWQCVFDND